MTYIEAENNAGLSRMKTLWMMYGIILQQPGSSLAEAVRAAYPMNSAGISRKVRGLPFRALDIERRCLKENETKKKRVKRVKRVTY